MQPTLFDRLEKINNSGLNDYYKVFLAQNSLEPIPGDVNFKNNLPYMFWIDKKHKEFRKINNLDINCGINKTYKDKFLKFLQNY